MAETYKAARVRLHRELAAAGWNASAPSLKVLWAENRDRTVRVWFKAQAVYAGRGGTGASIDHARSLWLDVRDLDVRELAHEAGVLATGRGVPL